MRNCLLLAYYASCKVAKCHGFAENLHPNDSKELLHLMQLGRQPRFLHNPKNYAMLLSCCWRRLERPPPKPCGYGIQVRHLDGVSPSDTVAFMQKRKKTYRSGSVGGHLVEGGLHHLGHLCHLHRSVAKG